MLAIRRPLANVLSVFLLIHVLILMCRTEAIMTGGIEVELRRLGRRKVAFLNP